MIVEYLGLCITNDLLYSFPPWVCLHICFRRLFESETKAGLTRGTAEQTSLDTFAALAVRAVS